MLDGQDLNTEISYAWPSMSIMKCVPSGCETAACMVLNEACCLDEMIRP